MDEFAFLDATAQAELVRRKEVKPIELVDAAIERIERLNPLLNAVVTPMYDHAREAAAGPLPHGPFTGVPFLLKDLHAAYAGVRMTMGSVFLRDFVPDHDSELVVRLKRAGLIVLGKTNTPEFGHGLTGPRLFGPTRNPWDLDRTPGGSSAGSGAAVAAGMVPMAHGNDSGGSIRIPASCCGLFGLKPTRARNPLGPEFGDAWTGLLVEHALTRTVRDSAALLDATCGPDAGAPSAAPAPARPFLQEVGTDPGRLRIAFSAESPFGSPVHPDCVSAVRDTAEVCAAMEHELIEAAPKLSIDGETLFGAFFTVFTAQSAASIDEFARVTGRLPSPDQFEPLTWAFYQVGRQHSAPAYLTALKALHSASRDIGRFFLQYDVWLTPTLAEPPVPIDTFRFPPEEPLRGLPRLAAFVPFTRTANVTGQPAMSVPLFWNTQGLPVGTHFIGRYGDEATLFRLAAQLEVARPWAQRRPPVAAQTRD